MKSFVDDNTFRQFLLKTNGPTNDQILEQLNQTNRKLSTTSKQSKPPTKMPLHYAVANWHSYIPKNEAPDSNNYNVNFDTVEANSHSTIIHLP